MEKKEGKLPDYNKNTISHSVDSMNRHALEKIKEKTQSKGKIKE